jgi:pyruvate, orthophosphate dikinase
MADKFVYDFEEGNRDMKSLLGGKGANLAEMTRMGLPVPLGFTVTCEACNAYRSAGRQFPSGMLEEVAAHLEQLERGMGRRLGDPGDPLLVSVRSGAPFSMPGMMDSVLNLGLNDQSVEGLTKQTGSERFAWDSYRRLVQMYGKTVMGVEGDRFEEALEHAKQAKGVRNDVELDEGDLRRLVEEFKAIIAADTGHQFPQDPREQLTGGVEAVFGSWDNKRAVDYRRKNKIDDSLGTAVNIQAMVFGNKGDDSGTGVAFTRNPANGDPHPYGDYLVNAQGEDVVSGIRNTMKLEEMGEVQPRAWEELQGHMKTLEHHYRDMCDIEFTVEQGKLWLLQTRIGKRTAVAEWIMAHDMLADELIDVDVAMLRLDADRLEELFKKVIAEGAGAEAIATGLNASPGAAVGKAVFSADDAQQWAERGEPVILVRRETTPDDYHGMIRSEGVLTSAGGTNSHAAVVARGEGIPAVCGADQVRVDRQGRKFTVDGTTVAEGDWVTIDGFTGKVYAGQLELADSPIERARSGDPEARKEKIWQAYARFMARADAVRRLKVRANADTPGQSANAIERGAEGIGLCRTEHMFLGEERVAAVRAMIFADTAAEEQAAYDVLLPLQRDDFVGILEAMDGKPVTVRLLDPPLHEFLPDQVELAVAVALATERGQAQVEVGADEALPLDQAAEMLAKVNDLHEANPMLGLRGVRLGIFKPGLYAMQVRAICEAAAQVKAAGGTPIVEIMIPLAATREELAQVREELEPVARQTLTDAGQGELAVVWGTMIELPRAALVAGEIAEVAEFFSFGTNDLTQTAFGFSRDDIGKFLGLYEERKLVPANPFVTVDQPGVGRLMQIASQEGRASRPTLKLGICGEHGGDPDSVRFCHTLGLDYVSCSPFRVPTARLAAGQAALGQATAASK